MTKSIITAVCYYDGELIIDEQLNAKYVGGKQKPAKVRRGCNFVELNESVYKATKINGHEFDIDLVCNWPTDSGSKAIKLSDDDDVEIMFSAVQKTIELYVGKTRIEGYEHSPPVVSAGMKNLLQ